MMENKERIKQYWTKRSPSFLNQRRQELHNKITYRWIDEIKEAFSVLSENKPLRILDVGCGTGYFSIILSKLGHRVTGIDLTPDMIEKGCLLAKEEGASCELVIMDAEQPEFPDETFDMVISRNLTWTLPNPELAYTQWIRVLKKGGVLLNFDADHAHEDPEEIKELPALHAHHMIDDQMRHENNEIKKSLNISAHKRPDWDVAVLSRLGVCDIHIDPHVSERIYLEKDQFYNPTSLFKMTVIK